MKHAPGSLKGPNARFYGRIVKSDAAFRAECWAEEEFFSHHAVEAAETQTLKPSKKRKPGSNNGLFSAVSVWSWKHPMRKQPCFASPASRPVRRASRGPSGPSRQRALDTAATRAPAISGSLRLNSATRPLRVVETGRQMSIAPGGPGRRVWAMLFKLH